METLNNVYRDTYLPVEQSVNIHEPNKQNVFVYYFIILLLWRNLLSKFSKICIFLARQGQVSRRRRGMYLQIIELLRNLKEKASFIVVNGLSG